MGSLDSAHEGHMCQLAPWPGREALLEVCFRGCQVSGGARELAAAHITEPRWRWGSHSWGKPAAVDTEESLGGDAAATVGTDSSSPSEDPRTAAATVRPPATPGESPPAPPAPPALWCGSPPGRGGGAGAVMKEKGDFRVMLTLRRMRERNCRCCADSALRAAPNSACGQPVVVYKPS